MKYLITGKNGQLAQSFIRRFEERSIHFLAPDETEFDITAEKIVSEIVSESKPDIIINCAAYNLVDKAEETPEAAFKVNGLGPKNLAQAASKQKALLIHFGSDYVFDGSKDKGLYTEDDLVNPLNEYGKSKLAGERYIQEEIGRYLIFRLSWVFGPGRQNFVHKFVQWAEGSEYLRIACDEFSVPTCTDTVVDVTLRAIDQGLTGLYHLTNSGYCSRFEWARLISRILDIGKFIRPVAMDSFNLPAKRPGFSAMGNSEIAALLNLAIPTWEEATKLFLQKGDLKI